MRFNSTLPTAMAALTLVSVPGIGQDNGTAFVGMVTDRNQTPLARAVVILSSNESYRHTLRCAEQFHFENVPRGTYDLECSAPGFARQKFSVFVGWCGLPWRRNNRSSQLPAPVSIILSTQTGPESRRAASRALLPHTAATAGAGLDPLGSPANWRCVALEKLSKV